MPEEIQDISLERYDEDDVQSLSPDKQAVKEVLVYILFIVGGILVFVGVILLVLLARDQPKFTQENADFIHNYLKIQTSTITEVLQIVLLNFFLPIITGLVGFLVGKDSKSID